ncbi:MAG: ParB/RepB/Spo0J family partition protein [Neisseriaceae bacterium]|nr:ParB/RepB/Spo0J family partition protein [Neisseriaceae bacterium]MBR6877061.1 ParB/RepB/Spo0J family partition protein [Neisseriaceae bacterium]
MSSKAKKALGRGLDSLMIDSGSLNVNTHTGDTLTQIDIKSVRAGRFQPRSQMNDDALQELAESIKAQGVIQPIIVREFGLDAYEIIAGERRWRAAQLAGLTEIPAVIKKINDKTAMAMGLIENIQREDLNPIEEAQGLRRLIEEFGLTHETIAEAIGRSRSAVSNSLRLLKLPEPIQEMLYQRQLEMGHARSLLSLAVNQQIDLAQKAVKNGWSVRETERRCQSLLQGKDETPPKRIDPDIHRLNEHITQQLGVNTEIQTRNGKKGKIVLHFDSADTFDYLLKRLGIENHQ